MESGANGDAAPVSTGRMNRLNRVTLVVTAVATSVGVSPAASAPDGPVYLRLPAISRIAVRRDTVWFCGTIEAGDARAEYYFVRRTREWRRVLGPSAAPCLVQGAPSATRSDTIRGAGFQVVRIDSTQYDSAGRRSGRVFLRLIDRAFGRQTDVVPRLDPKKRRAFVTTYGEAAGLDFADVSAIVANDTLLWIGLAGGFPEGEGAVGGIFMVHRPTGRYELLLDTLLEDATVSALVDGGRWLWVGTKVPGEYGWGGRAGLLRFDVRTRGWRSYQERTSPLPDPVIGAVASDGQLLAIATFRGLAVAELRPGSGVALPPGRDEAVGGWDVRYFVPSFERDSLVFDLGTKARHTAMLADESRYIFAQGNAQPGHERPLVTALARVPSDSLSVWVEDWQQWDRLGAMMADSSLLPMLMGIGRWPGPGMLVAAGAIGGLGAQAPASVVDSIRRAFASLEGYDRALYRVPLGRALALVGDSTSIRWARGVLQQAVSRGPAGRARSDAHERSVGELAAAAAIAGFVRDRASLGLVVSAVLVAEASEQSTFVGSLARYDDPNAWRALVAFARAKQLPRWQMLNVLSASALRDTDIANAVLQICRDELRNTSGEIPFDVLEVARRLRLHPLAPDFVDKLASRAPSGADYLTEATFRALVDLTGRGDAPVYPERVPPRTVAEWWSRLAAAPGGLPQASPETGLRAVAAWSARQAATRRAR